MKQHYMGGKPHLVTNWLRGVRGVVANSRGRSVKGSWNKCACISRVYAAKALDRRADKYASGWPCRGITPARPCRPAAEQTQCGLAGALLPLHRSRDTLSSKDGERAQRGGGAKRHPAPRPLPPCTNRGVER
jgi:hypothetical protein